MSHCSPFPVESGLGLHGLLCQGDISKCEEYRVLISTCNLELVLLKCSLVKPEHVRGSTTLRQPCCEDLKTSYVVRPHWKAMRCQTCKRNFLGLLDQVPQPLAECSWVIPADAIWNRVNYPAKLSDSLVHRIIVFWSPIMQWPLCSSKLSTTQDL